MFSHIMVGSNDIDRSKKFYDAVIGAVGGSPGELNAMGRLVYAHRGGRLLVTTPINGEPASGANGGTIGFVADSSKDVDAWHEAGVDNGGTTAESPPGVRGGGANRLYMAYLRDPDGNKLAVLHRLPA